MPTATVLLSGVTVLVVLFLLAPLAVVVASSFTSKGYLHFPPEGFSLRWYGHIADNEQFVTSFGTSLRLALATALVGVLVSVPGAVAISRSSRRSVRALEQLFLSPLVLPAVVFGLAYLILLQPTGLVGTFEGALLAHVVLTTPFVLRSTLTGLSQVDQAQVEASQSLGAGPVRTFFRVTLPAIRGSVIVGAVFAFIVSFDEAVVTLFIVGAGFTTLPVTIFTYLQYSNDPTVAALSTVLITLSAALMGVLARFTSARDHA